MNAPRVKVSIGWTRNMGNFESLRIDLGVEADAREGETTAQATARVYDFVSELLMEKVHETEAEIAGVTSTYRKG